MTVRRCLIHIGLAKTGTTAIQNMLERNVGRLAGHGWVYPRAGCKMPITPHHDLVADLAAHRSDIGRSGILRRLLEEIDASSGHVLFSSELFPLTLFDDGLFARFVRALQARGLEISVVIYLRNHADHIASLYLQYLKLGYDGTFQDWLELVTGGQPVRLSTGGIPHSFTLDHEVILDRLRDIGDVQVIARNYDEVSHSICPDFLTLLGIDPSEFGPGLDARANERPPARSHVLRFLQNRLRRRCTVPELRALEAMMPNRAGSRIGVSDALRQRIMGHFAASNERVARRFGVSHPPRTGACDWAIETLFSEDTQTRICGARFRGRGLFVPAWALRTWLSWAWRSRRILLFGPLRWQYYRARQLLFGRAGGNR